MRVNYKDVIRRAAGAGRPRREKEWPMDPLKISSVEFDDRDPYRATFNVHLSRDMTDFERQTLPPLLSGRFSPSEARGSAVVAIRNSTIAMIEDPGTCSSRSWRKPNLWPRQWNTSNMRLLAKSRPG